MAIVNSWFFTKQIFLWDVFAKATENTYKVVSVRKFHDKNGRLEDGYNLTLLIVSDNFDYGIDKEGVPRETNLFQSIDVTVLDATLNLKKGDMISLSGYLDEHSYVIGFDMLLRFKTAKILTQNNTKAIKENV